MNTRTLSVWQQDVILLFPASSEDALWPLCCKHRTRVSTPAGGAVPHGWICWNVADLRRSEPSSDIHLLSDQWRVTFPGLGPAWQRIVGPSPCFGESHVHAAVWDEHPHTWRGSRSQRNFHFFCSHALKSLSQGHLSEKNPESWSFCSFWLQDNLWSGRRITQRSTHQQHFATFWRNSN